MTQPAPFKRILVPTDFSSNSMSAFRYALALAGKTGTELVLYHAWSTPLSDPYHSFKQDREEAEKDYNLKNKKIAKWAQIAIEQNVSCRYIFNDEAFNDGFENLTKGKKYDLVVMGSKGNTGMAAQLIGSNTASVIVKSRIPVLAIPKKSAFLVPKKILLTVDYEKFDARKIKYVNEWATLFNSELSFLHVADEDYLEELENHSMKDFSGKVEKSITLKKKKFDVVFNDDVLVGVNKYAKEKNIDIVTVIHRHRNFFERLFAPNTSKKMVLATKLPLLVIPAK